jgi:hypothetical protein
MSRRRFPILVFCCLASSPLTAAERAIQSEQGGMVLRVPAGSARGRVARLVAADGRVSRLRLPSSADVTDLAELDDGWLASGTVDDPNGGQRLWLRLAGRGGSRELLPPRASELSIQRRPVPFVESGELVGLAWLEGAAAGGMGVRAAAWNGSGWSAPEWVARSGKGSQMALTGAVLADGSWLLVWSAFDGRDDEIVAARRSRAGWESPRRIGADNDVPDITPALTAAGDGAVVAWSRYLGDGYGLVRATFDGQDWHELEGSERGGLFPAFRGARGSSTLLYFDSRRRGWSALDLDARGGVVRRAELAGPASDEVPLFERGEDGVRLRDGSGGEFTGRWRMPR